MIAEDLKDVLEIETDEKVDKRDHRGRTNSIIQNNYNSVEYVTEQIIFNTDEYIGEDYKELDETLAEEEYDNYISSVISTEKFSMFNNVTTIEKSNSVYQKVYQIKKKEINDFYGELILNPKFDKYKLYVSMCYYLNMEKRKVFDMLSNLYKNQIIEEITKNQKMFDYKII